MTQTINEIEVNGIKYVPKSSVVTPIEDNTINWNNEAWLRKSWVDQKNPIQWEAANVDGMPFVLIRGYGSGVQYGYLKSREGCEVTLFNSRRIWSWNKATETSQIACNGIDAAGSKVTMIIPEKIITDAIEILFITKEGEANLKAQPVWTK